MAAWSQNLITSISAPSRKLGLGKLRDSQVLEINDAFPGGPVVLAGRGSQVCDGGFAFLKGEELARERSCAPNPKFKPSGRKVPSIPL